MAHSFQNLGGKVLRSPAEGVSRLVVLDVFFGEAEVCYADVPVDVYEHVLRL